MQVSCDQSYVLFSILIWEKFWNWNSWMVIWIRGCCIII